MTRHNMAATITNLLKTVEQSKKALECSYCIHQIKMVAVSEEKNSFGISSDYNSSGAVGGKEIVQGKKCMFTRVPERSGGRGWIVGV